MLVYLLHDRLRQVLEQLARFIAIFTRLYPQFPGRGESCIRPAFVPQGRPQGSPLHKGHRQLQTALRNMMRGEPRAYRLRPYTKSRKYGVFLFLENANAENQRRARREAGKRGYERVRQQYSYSSPGERPRFLSPNCLFAASIISSICGRTYPISTASFLFDRKKTFKISSWPFIAPE